MNGEPLTCPFCNAQVPVRPGMAAGQKIPCPRCDEVFTLTHTPTPAVQTAGPFGVHTTAPSASTVTADVPTVRTKPVGANRVLGLVVLGVMAFMATVGLIFALATQSTRRAHDTGIVSKARRSLFPSKPVEEPELAVAPARLAALGYLPPNMGVVAGIHVEELLASPVGKELLRQPIKVGEREIRLDNVLGWTSLRPDDIDHAVIALEPDAPFTTLLVVRTRKPYDAGKVRTALKARRSEGKKEVYRIEVPGLPLQPLLWCANERTLVVGLSAKVLEAVPATPVEGLAHLPSPVRTVLEERVASGGPLWAVGHADNWMETAAGLLIQKLKPEEVERVKQARTLALWLQPAAAGSKSTAVVLNATLACANPEAALALEEKTLRPLLPADTRLVREESWLTLQARVDLAEVRKALER